MWISKQTSIVLVVPVLLLLIEIPGIFILCHRYLESPLCQGLENFFCIRSGSKYFWCCGPYGCCLNYLTTLCSMKTALVCKQKGSGCVSIKFIYKSKLWARLDLWTMVCWPLLYAHLYFKVTVDHRWILLFSVSIKKHRHIVLLQIFICILI